MRPRRSGLLTTFAILNLVFGSLFLVCGVSKTLPSKLEWNGQDVTQMKDDFMRAEVPGYTAYRIGVLIVLRVLLAVGFIVSGIGLLRLWGWARFLALGCAVLAILYQVFGTIYELALWNPAFNRFNANAPIRLGNWYSTFETVVTILTALLAVAYCGALCFVVLRPATVRAFSGDYAEEVEAEEDLPRPQRRPARAEDDVEEAPPPRRRSPPRLPEE